MLRKSIIQLSLLLFFFVGLSRFFGIGDGGIEAFSSRIVYPFLLVQHQISQFMKTYKLTNESHSHLINELEESFKEREKLQQELLRLSGLLHFQTGTEELRGFLDHYGGKQSTISRILFKNFDGSHFYLIDRGVDAGITVGMIAAYKDCLVGRVTEVFPFYSKVLLITDGACKVAALCAETNAKGIYEGIRNHELAKLNYVNHLDRIKEGDLVLSSGDGLLFSAGFGLGRIKHWKLDGLNYSITLSPLCDLKRLEYCCILPHDVIVKQLETNDRDKT
jgi:rod shape-determining protein MreC